MSPKVKTARLGYFKRNKKVLSIFLLKIALFSHICEGSGIRTNFIQFLNFGEI